MSVGIAQISGGSEKEIVFHLLAFHLLFKLFDVIPLSHAPDGASRAPIGCPAMHLLTVKDWFNHNVVAKWWVFIFIVLGHVER